MALLNSFCNLVFPEKISEDENKLLLFYYYFFLLLFFFIIFFIQFPEQIGFKY